MDDVLVEQVLVNLLDNALKYTPPGSPIEIIATATDRAATVEVRRPWPGPAAGRGGQGLREVLPRAGDGRGRRSRARDLPGVVRAHGGRIWAQNLPEGGVAFLFTLPITGTPPTTDG